MPATQGSIHLRDQNLAELSRRRLREIRQVVQMVFQDPNAALNPSMTVEEAVADALKVHGMRSAAERHTRVVEALERVGLSPVELFLTKYPRDLSGGQKQRVVIARAIVLQPELLVADEPVSMLDMSVRAKILQLMLDLKQDLGLTYVYITHDLATAKYFCDRIAIMYLGRVVEIGPTEEIFATPRHPYTKALLAAIPEPDPDKALPRDLPRGEIPDAAQPPLGCAFHPRCPEAISACGWESRDLRTLVEEHWMRADAAYDEEQRVLGDLDHLDVPSTTATFGAGGGRRGARDHRPDQGGGHPRAALVGRHRDRGVRPRGHRPLRAGAAAGSAPGRRGRRRLHPLPRRERGLTGSLRVLVVLVPPTNGDCYRTTGKLVPYTNHQQGTSMKTRIALAALTLTALALPLAAIDPASASGRWRWRSPHPRRLRRPGGLEAQGQGRQRPDRDRGRGRQQPQRPGLGLAIKHNGSLSSKGATKTQRRQRLLLGPAPDDQHQRNGPLHVPCRASLHG